MSCSTKLSAKPLHISEVDWINQKVAEATGLPMKFLYQGDGIHPSVQAHQMDIEEYAKIQRENDTMSVTHKVACGTCHQDVERTPGRRIKSISQQAAMSEAWSRELRAKVKESERQREAKKPQICVEIDDYWD